MTLFKYFIGILSTISVATSILLHMNSLESLLERSKTFYYKFSKRFFMTKPHRAFLEEEEQDNGLHRNLSLFDLLCIGVGGTIGTGVFVLSGLIARESSGPSAYASFLIAGFTCFISASSFGELSSRIPSAGSTYAYSFASLGEYPAVLAAWALSLEYGLSGAAVSRSWGDKFMAWMTLVGYQMSDSFDSDRFNFLAGLLMLACVVLLLFGVNIGKITINILTVVKISIVVFMISVGFSQYNSSNMVPLAPWGFNGVLKGSQSCIFGYLGFDEVCCMAAETHDPRTVLPKAVFGTIIIVTSIYALGALSLVGMQYYTEISSDNCFPDAFRSHGLNWVAQIVSVGELFCLPLVTIVSFLPQPRLMYAMACDGFLPKIFSEIDSRGNLSKGIMISGAFCVLVAVFVPFTYLDEMIGAGVLFSFNLGNSSVIVIRRGHYDKERSDTRTPLSSTLLLGYHINSIIFAGVLRGVTQSEADISAGSAALVVLFLIISSIIGVCIYFFCPENVDPESKIQYRVPWMPLPPLMGILINYSLIAQLSWITLLLSIWYFLIATLYYVLYCLPRQDTVSLRFHTSMLLSTHSDAPMAEFTCDNDHSKSCEEVEYRMATATVITGGKMNPVQRRISEGIVMSEKDT